MNGQMSSTYDTIKIKEVVISRKKLHTELTGYKMITIDSLILKNYGQSSIADLLSENSTIFIKSYGVGGIATPSLRGTGAGHIRLAWNNIDINQPMLGQADLSLVPAGLIDDIQVYYGAASMALNNGGIGGIVNLETKPEWKKNTVISVNTGIGSFGRYTGLVKIKSGNIHFQTVTKGYVQSSENDFRYLNNDISAEPVWQTRINSQVRQKGFIQELYFRRTKNVASARIWYQSCDRNLPSSTLTQQVNSGEKQFDESLRTMLNYDLFGNRSNYSITGAWILDRLNYQNRLASVDSRNLSEILILKAEMENRVDQFTKLKVVINEEMSIVKSNNYSHNESRNSASVTISAERSGCSRFGTTILVREILDKNTFLIPDFSAGLQFRLTDAREYFIKANISRNSKIPTMNDMFWTPGGNPGLRNEYAYLYEFAFDMKQMITSHLNIKYNTTFFRNNIRDMIQWHPGEYSYWTADNIQNVNTMGVESSFSLDYLENNFKSRFTASYSYTKATSGLSDDISNISVGKQLMYVPVNMANTILCFGFKNIYSSWATTFTGKRFITVDNTKYLPEYLINNISAGVKLSLKGALADLNFNIDNLFNIAYQSIAYYPLPGRSYTIKFLVQIVN